jgi:DNA polymerase III sliding clamp (beta) subunit (PCNA family)
MKAVRSKDLYDHAALAALSLSAHTLVPTLAHLWFNGTSISASNDVQAIEVKGPDIGLKCMIPGDLFLRIIRTFDDSDMLQIEQKEREVIIQSESAVVNLPCIPFSPLFTFDTLKPPTSSTKCGSDFFVGLKKCSISTGTMTEQLQTQGIAITTSKNGGGATLYATDNLTLSRYIIEADGGFSIPQQLLLPGRFCNQLLEARKYFPDVDCTLNFVEGGVVGEFGPSVRIFSRLEVASTYDFSEVVAKYFNEADAKQTVPIPGKIRQCVKRIIAVKSREKDSLSVWKFDEEYLTLSSKDALGMAEDSALVGPVVNKTYVIDTTLVDRVLESVDDIVLPRADAPALAFLSGGAKFLHLIANYS